VRRDLPTERQAQVVGRNHEDSYHPPARRPDCSLDARRILPVKAITLMDILSPILWLVNELTGGYLNRRRVRVQVHTAYFRNGNPTPYCFVKVTNTSSKRDVEVTHV
jgi:hypothetical protein